MKRLIAIAALAVAAVLIPTAAGADQPGPGDSQCVPGQQGNPHPAHKGGVCPNP